MHKMNRYGMNKKGVSLMISYILLVGMMLALSAVVATWIYTQAKNPPLLNKNKCEGITVLVEDISCNNGEISATVVNTGRFSIEKVYVRADTEERNVLRHSLNTLNQKLEPGSSADYSTNLLSELRGNIRVKFIPYVNGVYCSDQISYDVEC